MIGLVAAQGDTFELFEFAKEILDQMPPLVNLGINLARRECWAITTLAPRSAITAFESKAVSAIRPPKATLSISGATPTVSKRWPGSRTKRTRLPSASVSARIFVVQPPFDWPMAWLCVPL